MRPAFVQVRPSAANVIAIDIHIGVSSSSSNETFMPCVNDLLYTVAID